MTIRSLILAAALALAALPAAASEFERVGPVTNAAAKKECGACHMAYQPALLPAAGWKKVFGDLANHFGENATLPEATRQAVEAYYLHDAGRNGAAAPARISEQTWWQQKHRKIADAKWTSPQVKTKANCNACHRDAERGNYEDD